MSRHPSGIQLRSIQPRVLEARAALEGLHAVLDSVELESEVVDLVHAARALWIAMVFDLAGLQEESPLVDEIDLERTARRAANRYEAFVAPLIDFDPHAPRAHAAIRDAIGRAIDALDVHVDAQPRSA